MFNQFITTVEITDTNTIIETVAQNETYRDTYLNSAGDYATWFTNTITAHKTKALALPSLTSTRVKVSPVGQWLAFADASGVATTGTSTLKAPVVGTQLMLKLNPTNATAQRSVNGGAFVTFANGAIITAVDGQTLAFKGINVDSNNPVVGKVIDLTNNTIVDQFCISSS